MKLNEVHRTSLRNYLCIPAPAAAISFVISIVAIVDSQPDPANTSLSKYFYSRQGGFTTRSS